MKFMLFLACLCLCSIAKATDFYVDPSSTSSTQNGTQANPWKTLTQVNNNMNSFNPGDFIYFKRGQTFTGKLNITRSGTVTAPITFGNYGTGALPIFTNTSGTLIVIGSLQYVVIDGFNITDPTMSPTDRTAQAKVEYGISIYNSNHITLKNLDVSLIGVGVEIQGDFNTVTTSKFGNLRMVRNTPTSVNADDDYGANPMVVSGNDNLITYNSFIDCWATSYDYGYDGGAVELFGGFSRNKVLYNKAINCNGFIEIGSSNGGTAADNLIAYNLMINNGLLTWMSLGTGNFTVNVSNLQYFNNTIVETNNLFKQSYLFDYSGSPSNQVLNLKNNVFYLSTGIDVMKSGKFAGTLLSKGNNVFKLTNGSVANYTLDATEISTTAAVFTNTSSTDPAAWDYTLTAASPAINKGQNLNVSMITKDFAGNTFVGMPDAGILEYTTSSGISNPLAASSTAGTINCNAGTTTVTVNATGGKSPYTGTGTFTVSAGTYNYTVTDANGASATTSVTVSQPTVLNATVSAGTIDVFGGTTIITASATGGTAPYTYSINNGTYQSSNTFANTLAGIYSIIAKDTKGCTSSAKSLTILQPGAGSSLIISATTGTIGCNGGTTAITLTATGGTTPYSGLGTFTVTAGTYNYTVTDAKGSTGKISVTVSQPTALNVSVSTGSITSKGGTTSITVNITGGKTGYSYSLNGGAYQSSNIFSSVAAGNHSIVVKDANNCTASKAITVTQPASTAVIISLASKTDVRCKGGSNGSIQVSATGGTSPYTYSINNGLFSSTSSFYTLKAGDYAIQAKDATGATASLIVNIASGKRKCQYYAGKSSAEEVEEDIIPAALKITAFPNPTTTEFSLMTETGSTDAIDIIVMDMEGKRVFQAKGKANNKIVFGNNFISGTYIVRVIQGKESQTLKLVKAK